MSTELRSLGVLMLVSFVLAVGCGSESETNVGSTTGGPAGSSGASADGGTGEVTTGGAAGSADETGGSGGAAGSTGGTDGGTGGDGTGGDGTGGDVGSGGDLGTGGDGTGGNDTGGNGTGGNGTGGNGTGGDGTGGDLGTGGDGTGGDETGGDLGTGGDGTGGDGTGGDLGTGGDGTGGNGTGGTGGQWPECESASDCTLISTCCTCLVAPVGTPAPEGCDILCDTDLCTANGFGRDDVACQHGFCGVVGADGTCNSEDVTCAASPPPCPTEYLPSVVDGCWGPCVLQYSCLSAG